MFKVKYRIVTIDNDYFKFSIERKANFFDSWWGMSKSYFKTLEEAQAELKNLIEKKEFKKEIIEVVCKK